MTTSPSPKNANTLWANPTAAAGRRSQLTKEGFCVFPDILDREMIERLRSATDKRISGLTNDHLDAQKSTGTMIGSGSMPELADLIAWPPALKVLDELGFRDTRFWTGYVISKPGPSPRLFWHQDGIMWDDARSYSDTPPMVFFMYYLTNTTRENGCLRVIPGTHRRRHPLHDLAGEAHTEAMRRMENPDSPAFADQPGEVDVMMRAGDLLVGDARLFHATHTNTSTTWRTVITLWYHPEFSDLEEPTQAYLAASAQSAHENWPTGEREKIAPLLASYAGFAAKRSNRPPDARLA